MQVPYYRLITLMELLRFEADSYCRLMNMIGQILAHFQIAANAPPTLGMSLNENVFGQLGATMREIGQHLETLNLPLAQRQLERMQEDFRNNSSSAFTNQALARSTFELTARIVDELEQRLFLSVPIEQAEMYLQTKPPFGSNVIKKFPQMTEDISDAAKCLALDQSTACVFHLMRVMELAVQRFGSELSISLVSEKNWQVILDQINAAIRKLDQKDERTKKYTSAASHLYNVKVAWRNEVMHPKQTYRFEEAKAIFENVRTFIGDLGTV